MPYLVALTEGTGTVSVDTALETGTQVFTWVMTTITSSALLTAAFCLSVLVPAGVMVFRKVTRSV